jgi:hypothetical protein
MRFGVVRITRQRYLVFDGIRTNKVCHETSREAADQIARRLNHGGDPDTLMAELHQLDHLAYSLENLQFGLAASQRRMRAIQDSFVLPAELDPAGFTRSLDQAAELLADMVSTVQAHKRFLGLRTKLAVRARRPKKPRKVPRTSTSTSSVRPWCARSWTIVPLTWWWWLPCTVGGSCWSAGAVRSAR